MAVCYWCHWGWPKPIRDIYDAAVEKLGDSDPMQFGPGHVVWCDENWDCAQWCLDHFDEYRGDLSDAECEIVRQSLVDLLAVPDEYKSEPAGYDDENPDEFPPPEHWGCEKA